jgi:hypothetical protein
LDSSVSEPLVCAHEDKPPVGYGGTKLVNERGPVSPRNYDRKSTLVSVTPKVERHVRPWRRTAGTLQQRRQRLACGRHRCKGSLCGAATAPEKDSEYTRESGADDTAAN